MLIVKSGVTTHLTTNQSPSLGASAEVFPAFVGALTADGSFHVVPMFLGFNKFSRNPQVSGESDIMLACGL